ncbi:MAG: hypothetical protein M3P48_00305 [Actinomycetota bacterium]|nr:hypothetical protein [Actinomycetota bacterium]
MEGDEDRPQEEPQGQWIEIPLPSPLTADDGFAWHYTDASGLLGIIESDTLWASAPSSLNDTKEMIHGAEVISRVWQERREEVINPCRTFVDYVLETDLLDEIQGNIFILSASRNGDLLNQWQHYAQGDGFAIGIDPTCPLVLQP